MIDLIITILMFACGLAVGLGWNAVRVREEEYRADDYEEIMLRFSRRNADLEKQIDGLIEVIDGTREADPSDWWMEDQ